jgi:prophage regulatory protein
MNAHSPISSPYLTVVQVAERYGVSTDTIWRWKRDGRLPSAVRIGPNCTRWRLSDLLEHEVTFETCFAYDAQFSLASP